MIASAIVLRDDRHAGMILLLLGFLATMSLLIDSCTPTDKTNSEDHAA